MNCEVLFGAGVSEVKVDVEQSISTSTFILHSKNILPHVNILEVSQHQVTMNLEHPEHLLTLPWSMESVVCGIWRWFSLV